MLWINFMFVQSTIHAQSAPRHLISLEISPLQYFYDGVSPFNSKDGMLENNILPFVFKGRFRGSAAVKYGYIVNHNYEFRLGFSTFQATGYSADGYHANQWNLSTRYHRRLTLEVRRNIVVNNSITAFLGIGSALRFDRSVLRYSNENCVNCPQVDQHYSVDIGLDGVFGVRTKLTNRISTSVSIENMWIVHRGGATSVKNLEVKGGSIIFLLPRFSTALNFGLEFRF